MLLMSGANGQIDVCRSHATGCCTQQVGQWHTSTQLTPRPTPTLTLMRLLQPNLCSLQTRNATKNIPTAWPCRSIEKQLPDAAVTSMLQASLLSREGKAKEADAALAALATAPDPAQAAEAGLLRAQLAAAGNNAAAALQHLSVSLYTRSIPTRGLHHRFGFVEQCWEAFPGLRAWRSRQNRRCQTA